MIAPQTITRPSPCIYTESYSSVRLSRRSIRFLRRNHCDMCTCNQTHKSCNPPPPNIGFPTAHIFLWHSNFKCSLHPSSILGSAYPPLYSDRYIVFLSSTLSDFSCVFSSPGISLISPPKVIPPGYSERSSLLPYSLPYDQCPLFPSFVA